MDGLDVDGFVRDLEALKRRLFAITPAELPPGDAGLLAEQISAIRLQLKRLAADREQVAADVARSLGSLPDPPPRT